MTNRGGRQRRGALLNQAFTLPRSRAEQRRTVGDRQTVADIVVVLLALLLFAALALRLFTAGHPPTVDSALGALGAALLDLGR